MSCCGNRGKKTREFADQKWDYINLNDFKAKGCGTPFAYAWLWFSLALSVTVYSVDSFTAVNLLVYDRWSSKIQPKVPLSVSKWIFSICIILSFVNLAFEGIRAWRVMRRENVAECYMDNLAVKWESIRLGRGQGWKRFLVFAALTKSKKGAEYIALFTYFAFKSWIRVILCSGPRQVVNAMTLISVYQAQLEPGSGNVGDSIKNFFDNIATLAREDYQQAVILSGMAFTFVIWAISALTLLVGVLFYVFFLFHWIPRSDGGLHGYCERKVNKTLLKIVTKTVNKALAKQQAKAADAEAKAIQRGEKPHLDRAATLPTLPNMGPDDGSSLAKMPTPSRQNTSTTLQGNDARSGTPSNIEMTRMTRRPPAARGATGDSASTYSSRQPLLSSAADMGYGRSASPAPSLPGTPMEPTAAMTPPPVPPHDRPGTSMSDRRQPTLPNMGVAPQRAGTMNGMPPRQPTLPNMGQPTLPNMGEPTLPNMDQTLPDRREPTLPNMGNPTMPGMREPTLPNMGEPTLPDLSQPTTDLHKESQLPAGEPTLPNVDFNSPQRPGQPPVQMPNSFGGSHQAPITASPDMMDTAVMPSFPDEGQKYRNVNPHAQSNGRSSPAFYETNGRSTPVRENYSSRPSQRSGTPGSAMQPPHQTGAYQAYIPEGRSSPAPSMNPYRQGTPVNRQQTPIGQPPMGQPPMGNGPSRRDLTGPPPMSRGTPDPYRNMSTPASARPPPGGYFANTAPNTGPPNPRGPPRDRYGTPGSQRQRGPGYGYGYDVESQRGGPQ